ncbi:hypothetical protein ACA910_022561 [Epithemia clementina (nom. ined.)]
MATATATTPATARILCCLCGVLIEPNSVNTCSACLASQSDITRGISTEATLHQCRGCGRWHKDAGKWIACELESRELMGLCLSHVSGLKHGNNNKQQERVRLVDAGWIWTEPHSMRLKVRLTVQRQVQQGTILQQSFTVTFIVRNQQCLECQAEFRQGSWTSLVQVRQRVRHKRTFLYLEQLILKQEAHRGCLRIETFRDGMDFYFPDKGKAARFIAFLENVCPIKVKTSKKLISTDLKSNIANFKYTNFVEICPLCKDDLLFLPVKLARNLGNIARLVLVKNISNVIHLIDPRTGQTASMTSDAFWREPVRPIITAARSRMTRYVVLGKDAVFLRPNASKRTTTRKQKSRLASLTLAREEDLGVNDQQCEERSHVGYLMKSGDVCLGYDLTDTNLADDEAETVRQEGNFPDVVVVRKLYGGAAMNERENRARAWRLQRLKVQAGEEEEGEVAGGRGGRGKRNGSAAIEDRNEMDEEEFMQEVEADKEMRLNINLYKNKDLAAKRSQTRKSQSEADQSMPSGGDAEMQQDDATSKNGDDDDDDDDQRITLDELLDSLALDDGADKDPETTPMMHANPDERGETGIVMSTTTTMYEEGARAAKDGLKYVSREEARTLQDKGTAAVVVVQDGESSRTTPLEKDFGDDL